MNNNNGNNNQKSVDNQYRSSQVYKTLTGSGNKVADKIAEGIGKATIVIDSTIETINQPGQKVQQGAAAGQKQQHQYNYSYNYTNTSSQNGQTAQTNHAARPAGTPQQPGYTPGHTPGYVPPSGTQAPHPGVRYQNPPVQQNPKQSYYKAPHQAPQYRQTVPSQQAAPPQGVKVGPGPQVKMIRQPSPAKFYITGAAALVYAMSAPLYLPVHFLYLAAVVLGVFVLSSVLFKGKKKYVPVPQEAPKEEPVKETGNSEIDKLIEEGRDYLKKLRKADEDIPDPEISACITRMEKASADIFNYIAENHDKAPQIRKFMNYYLPTTLKLLESYKRLDSQQFKGENIQSTMTDISRMMHTVADAFEKQLDSLFDDEAMDISTDISVFETMLKQEGFVEDKTETL